MSEVLLTMSNAHGRDRSPRNRGDEIKRAAVARFIIRLAQEDGQPRCVALRDRPSRYLAQVLSSL